MNRYVIRLTAVAVCSLLALSCSGDKKTQALKEAAELDFLRGELALCGAPDFGEVHFGLTCTESVQQDFNLAIALLHSFEYKEAEKAFVRVIDADPQCAIAYWGVAMSNLHELWAPPTSAESEKCSKILAVARSLPTKSVKEAEYIDAISVYFEDWETVEHQVRADRYSRKMKDLYLKYPDDKEAAVFYALALNGTADPKDKTYAKQLEAGELLTSLFPEEPDHPGIAHYLIHNYDYPELAEKGLDAARRYSSIAPASAHAQHMPSHIFTRLGLWEESISSNIRSADASVCYADRMQMQGHDAQELHALDYLMYAYLQQADDDAAGELLAYVNSMDSDQQEHFASAYALAAIPSRMPLEHRRWSDAAGVALFPETYSWERFPWERAIVHFTRVIGMARSGQLGNVDREMEALQESYDQLVAMEDVYKSNQVKIQMLAAEAWVEFAQGNTKSALRLMHESADMEDATGKHPVTPGEVLPARELLADMYMETGDYGSALTQYEAVLRKAPNRYNTIYGAGLAAEYLNKREAAAAYYSLLLDMVIDEPGRRSTLEHAEQFLAGSMS